MVFTYGKDNYKNRSRLTKGRNSIIVIVRAIVIVLEIMIMKG